LKENSFRLLLSVAPQYPSDMANQTELTALKNLISEVDLLLSTTAPLPENRTACCRELLSAAIALTDDLLKQPAATPAAIMGHKGGRTSQCEWRFADSRG
jgi:hypothetical protein